MVKKNRDDFGEKVKLQLAKRAGWLCSDPSCRRPTVGSNSDRDGEINVGVAAHICAAAAGGPRYDPAMTPEQRKSPSNGIWLCQIHAKAIDAKDSSFTVELLREWKAQAEKDSWRRVMYNEAPHRLVVQRTSKGELSARVHAATVADLETFRHSDNWPSTRIPLTLEVDGLTEPVSSETLAAALTELGDLNLVAPPGMGKTTTLLQVAEAIVAKGTASPIMVPLGEWSAEKASLLESVLRRPAFRSITEADLRSVAAEDSVVLLLDGWNELDSAARMRATSEIARLQRELPELGLLISTRKQALDVPIHGTRVNLLPLNDRQQLDIARALRGNEGERIVDQSWRTAGVRELVTIPLYLTVLLALPEGVPFPATREEVLRRFIAVHEDDHQHAEKLAQATYRSHQRFLDELAATATRAANTVLAEGDARRSISETDEMLVAEGQITEKPQPYLVLEALVSHHVLIRVGDTAGYSFQHQQFQEWYASHFVERLMLASVDDEASCKALKGEVLNQPPWEEAILFACQRLARGGQQQQEACGSAILDALSVDPILAAEMIHHSTDNVWDRVGTTIQSFVRRWHTNGRVDRALRFMISSGRPEFFDQVWPLITHEDHQVRLAALSAGRCFRPSLLGADAANRLAALPPEIRQDILYDIAFESDTDGLDLVTAVARDDPDPEIRARVVDALAFHRADRHIAEVLRSAESATFDLLAQNDLIDDVDDEAVKAGLAGAHERLLKQGARPYDQMYSLTFGRSDDDRSTELTKVIAEMEIDDERRGVVSLVYEAKERFPRAVAEGILRRVKEGRTLPHRAAELMVGSGFKFEDDELRDIALGAGRSDGRANAAASVLGPKAVGYMIERMLEARKLVRDAHGQYHESAANRYRTIHERIGNTQISSLLEAIRARPTQAACQELAELADLISRHPQGESGRGQPFDARTLATVAGLAEDWGKRLLDSPDATRAQLAGIATLISRAPCSSLLPLLQRLLDENLRRWRTFKEQALADQYRGGIATDEARMSWTGQYRRAFEAIGGPETAELMRQYLADQDFGTTAAMVLAEQWHAANEQSDGRRWRREPNFSRVTQRRAERASDPTASSSPADAIFRIVEAFISIDPTETSRRHAVALAIVAAALPHGLRGSLFDELVAIADRYPRCRLLSKLVLSGEIIDVKLVEQGIADAFDAAHEQPWILTSGHELGYWLRLLPFTSQPAATFDILWALPEQHRQPDMLKEVLEALGFAPDDAAEDVLFQLAEADPRFYGDLSWRDAVIGRGTLSAAMRLVDLAARGEFSDKDSTGQWHVSTSIAGLIDQHTELRAYVYDVLRTAPASSGTVLLADAVTESPDSDGLLLLLQLEINHHRNYLPWRTVELVVSERIPSEHWKDIRDVQPAPAVELREKLLAMTTDGGPNDAAARCLRIIDEFRDRFGAPVSEPRHPDLASGRAWPVLRPDPHGTAG